MKKPKNKRVIWFSILGVIIAIAVIASLNSLLTKPTFSAGAKTKHLVVISVDALKATDYDQFKNLPNFKSLLDNGSYAKQAIGVYPALTYPSHTAIITGTYPYKNGIFTNEIMEVGSLKQYWYWHRSDIKVPTLYDIAKEHNMKTGSLFWPVTAKAKIDYNLPEIWAIKDSENQTKITLTNGSPLFIIDINNKFGKMRNGSHQPELDDFITASGVYLISKKKPNLTLIHLSELDHTRHKTGTFSNDSKEALNRMDARIGKLIQAAKDGEIYNDTTFVVLGDHGFSDADYQIFLNAEFKNQGLITVDSNNKITDWKVYSNYCDGSAQIKLKDPKDTETRKKVEDLLNKLKQDPKSGIETVYTKEGAMAKKVVGDFDYMVEAKKGYFFLNDWKGKNLVELIDKANIIPEDDNSYMSTHGYDPLKSDMYTFFMASGPSIKKGIVLPSINIVDEGPTMAAILGLNMPNTDGRVLNEMLQK